MSLTISILIVFTGILLVILLTSKFRINSFLSLFIASLAVALAILPLPEIVPVLKKGFGDTMNSIGLIIIFGTIIGVTLDFTGATMSIANWLLKKVRSRNAPIAITITGFITGLPIFCDSGFVVLSGINRSMAAKSKFHPVLMASLLAGSLYSVHNLIPPHPGATAAAGIIGADIGKLVLVGTVVAAFATVAGFVWVRFITRKVKLATDVEKATSVDWIDETQLPSVSHSLVPIWLPLLLITVKAVLVIPFQGSDLGVIKTFSFIGDPVIALLIGMFASFTLLAKEEFKNKVNHYLQASIEKAGPIIIVTAAGGVFGAVIKSTGIGDSAGAFLATTGLGLLVPFLISFILKTAQGSSTIAIIATASIISPMLAKFGFESDWEKLLVMLSMGAGSMMVSHANDSYFWVITNFSKIEADDTLKVYSSMTIVMGLSTLGMVMLLSLI